MSACGPPGGVAVKIIAVGPETGRLSWLILWSGDVLYLGPAQRSASSLAASLAVGCGASGDVTLGSWWRADMIRIGLWGWAAPRPAPEAGHARGVLRPRVRDADGQLLPVVAVAVGGAGTPAV